MIDKEFWQRQEDKPLHPDASWAKPERKSQAGKLLIIGGNGLEFTKTQAAYTKSLDLRVGECKVVLPKSAHKVVGIHPDIEFAPSNAQGSFNIQAKNDLDGYLSWSDTVLLPGELGRSSETAQVLEHISNSTDKRLVITRDAADMLKTSYLSLLRRPNTTLIISLAQLQELGKIASWPAAFRFQMSLSELVEQLHLLTTEYTCNLVIYFEKNLICAVGGKVTTTRLDHELESWRLQLSVIVSAWLTWISPEQALTTAVWQFKQEMGII